MMYVTKATKSANLMKNSQTQTLSRKTNAEKNISHMPSNQHVSGHFLTVNGG